LSRDRGDRPSRAAVAQENVPLDLSGRRRGRGARPPHARSQLLEPALDDDQLIALRPVLDHQEPLAVRGHVVIAGVPTGVSAGVEHLGWSACGPFYARGAVPIFFVNTRPPLRVFTTVSRLYRQARFIRAYRRRIVSP